MNHPGEAGESEGNPLIAVEEGRGGDAAGGAAGPAAAAPARSSGSQFVGCAACTMLLGVLAVLVFDSPALLWMGAAGDGSVTWVTVALYTLPMALTAGLGGLPFFFVKDVSASFEGAANAMASGVMLAVSFDLLDEILCTPAAGALPAGQVGAAFKAVLGLAAGALFIRWSQNYLEQREKTHGELRLGSLTGLPARKAVLLVFIMTLHSFGEGSGVGISWSGQRGAEQGMLVTLAIALHNIPEGLAVALVLVARGETAGFATGWAVLSALGQPVTAVPAFVFVESFTAIHPVGLGFAAGSMVYIVLCELLPDAYEQTSRRIVALTGTSAAATMFVARAAVEAWRVRLESSSGPD